MKTTTKRIVHCDNNGKGYTYEDVEKICLDNYEKHEYLNGYFLNHKELINALLQHIKTQSPQEWIDNLDLFDK